MKKLMLGNEAAARGLYEAGCSLISSYPGTPSTEITERAAQYDEIYCEWAPNEKVAMEVAFGAALAGKRSACVMKHVGVNVAADPLFTIAYTGINAGMVICVADDAGMHSSQNEQDSRHYAVSAKIPMLEPADSEEARQFAKRAFQLSEEYDTPVFLKLCTRISHSQSLVELGEREEPAPRPYVKDIAKYVMVPGNARPRHPIVEARTQRLIAYAETTDLNREEMGEDTSLGIITSSTCYQYAREVFGPQACVLPAGAGGAGPGDRGALPELRAHRPGEGRPAHDRGVLPGPGGGKAGQGPQALGGPGRGGASPAPGPLRRLSPPGAVLHPGQAQGYGAGGHRLLHPGGLRAPLRH